MTAQIDQEIIARFWAKVDRAEPDQCWMWKAHRKDTGYGTFRAGRMVRAHRFMWMITNGPIPDDLHVCHKCDNPPCVNPNHLFLGTISDNLKDCVAKGRRRYDGEYGLRTRLKPSQVRKIRASTEPLNVVAARYGISFTHVSSIRHRRTWKTLP